jgi:class 3 adenylate cyclase/CHASE2 domain-containing sensor protein
MIKLSKETKWVFLSLLLVPTIWVGLNYSGVVDYLENKSLDLRFKIRGNLDHQSVSNEEVLVDADNNKTVPKIPKVIYVNFDAATLSMDEVGERPWNRSFFREVASVLLREGKARVVGFDFIFSPKSSSSMVPEENVYISDTAIAKLVAEFPNQVVLASAYTGVQTQFLKNETVNFLSSVPYLSRGFDPNTVKARYPESPTYPIFNYTDGKYVGLNGLIFSQPSVVDGLNRDIGIWFPGGGRAHAYNIMGAKLSKLKLEGIEYNETKYPKLVEDDGNLNLVWNDQNGTLVETLPNSMPLYRERDFYTVGLECLLAYYGLDEKAVLITEDKKVLTVTTRTGNLLLEVPLQDQQLIEINWFSNWKETQLREKLFTNIKNFYDVKDKDSYIQSSQDLFRLMFREFFDGNQTQEDLTSAVELLRSFEMEEGDIQTIASFLEYKKEDNKEDFPEYSVVEKLLAKLDANMNLSPADLNGNFNPMCSMSDILRFSENKSSRLNEINDIEVKLIPQLINNKNKIRGLLYDFIADENTSLVWSNLQLIEGNLLRNYENFQKFKLPAIQQLIEADEEKKRELLRGLEVYEKSLLENNSDQISLNLKDPKEMGEALRQYSQELKSLISEKDKLDGLIANFKRSLEQLPGNETIIQQINIQSENKIRVLANIESHVIKSFGVIDSLINLYEKLKKKYQKEIGKFEKFFANFNDSIVLIGPEEATFQDLSPTPMDKEPVPKVSVHGNVIKTLSSEIFITRMFDTKEASSLLIFMLCLVSAALSSHSSSWTSWVGILLLAGFVLLGVFLFSSHHIVIPLATPALAGLNTYVFGLAAMVVIEQKAKGKLKGMFGSYVSSDLVEQMVESGEEPKLGGEETAITAFFSDVQAFSSFSELLTPTGLVDLMNEYLTEMTNILQEERGTLDKYIGDAIVAMYGAPIPMEDHAYQAVRTAILMQQKQIQLREKWVPEVEKWGKCHGLVTQMQTRIGCNTGTATVGNMGALDRFNYTMMGDMVNLAARCESGAKAYGAYIMVTEETKIASSAKKDDIAFRYLDKIVVKGRSQPVAMFEPTGFMNELTQETQDCLDCFQQGIDKYLLQDWGGALDLFAQAKEMEPNKPGVTPGVKDNPSMILIDRCKVMQENPPGDDWDGVYIMTTK